MLRASLEAKLAAAEQTVEHMEHQANTVNTRYNVTRNALEQAIMRATALENQVEALACLVEKCRPHAHDSRAASCRSSEHFVGDDDDGYDDGFGRAVAHSPRQ